MASSFASAPWRRAATAGLAVLLLAGACAPRIDTRGNLPDPENVLRVQPGIDGKQQVADILGTPSTLGTFDDNVWYYISRRTETLAFFEPDVVDQQVLAIRFDATGTVSDMLIYGYEDAQIIVPQERSTPTLGRELTILEQLIGNLGRFNKDIE